MGLLKEYYPVQKPGDGSPMIPCLPYDLTSRAPADPDPFTGNRYQARINDIKSDVTRDLIDIHRSQRRTFL